MWLSFDTTTGLILAGFVKDETWIHKLIVINHLASTMNQSSTVIEWGT